MARYIDPVPQYLDGAGNPFVNGQLFFFKSGTNTQLITYKDELESIANTQPVLLDAAARVPNIFFSGTAKVILIADDLFTGETGKQIFGRDPVGGEKELGNFSLWDTTVTYDLNDIVEGSNGEFYKSLTNSNQASDPLTNADKWELFKLLGVWNTNITYSIGDVVLSSIGNLWKALTATSANDPETDNGTNWIPAIDGAKVPEVTALEALNVWINKSANFTAIARESYQIDGSSVTVDVTMPTLAIGDVFTFHNETISTNKVQILNPSYTIKGTGGVIAAGTDLELSSGDSVQLVAKSTTILEIVGAQI